MNCLRIHHSTSPSTLTTFHQVPSGLGRMRKEIA